MKDSGLLVFLGVCLAFYLIFELIVFVGSKSDRKIVEQLAKSYPYRPRPGAKSFRATAFAFLAGKPILNRVRNNNSTVTGNNVNSDRGFASKFSTDEHGLTIKPFFSSGWGHKFTVPWDNVKQIRYGTLDTINEAIPFVGVQSRVVGLPKDQDLKLTISSAEFALAPERILDKTQIDNPTFIRIDFDDFSIVMRRQTVSASRGRFYFSVGKGRV